MHITNDTMFFMESVADWADNNGFDYTIVRDFEKWIFIANLRDSVGPFQVSLDFMERGTEKDAANPQKRITMQDATFRAKITKCASEALRKARTARMPKGVQARKAS